MRWQLVVAIATVGWSADSALEATVNRPTYGRTGEQTDRDTVVVEHRRGKVLEAVEVLRVKGPKPGRSFGTLAAVQAMHDGGVVVLDVGVPSAPQLIKLDRNGKFVRNIGRQGSGPGEYGLAIFMAVAPDSTLLVGDFHGARVIRFRKDGSHLKTMARAGLGGPLYPSHRDGFYVHLTLGRTRFAVRVDSNERFRDTLRPPDWLPKREPYRGKADYLHRFSPSHSEPRQAWTVLPDGSLVLSRTDRLGLLIVAPNKKGPPRLINLASKPIPYGPEERRELEAAEEWLVRNRFPAESPILVPKLKQLAYPVNDPDLDGRLWLRIHVPAIKGEPRPYPSERLSPGEKALFLTYYEPLVFVGFKPDGAYLGEVHIPTDNPTQTSVSFVGEFVWVATVDESDEPVLIKYRLVPKR